MASPMPAEAPVTNAVFMEFTSFIVRAALV